MYDKVCTKILCMTKTRSHLS